jgi:hypothetical protein
MLGQISFTTSKKLYYKGIKIELYIDFERIGGRNKLRFRFYSPSCTVIYTTFKLDKLRILKIVDMVKLLENVFNNVEIEGRKIIRTKINDNYQMRIKIINTHNHILICFHFLYYGFMDTAIDISFDKKMYKETVLNMFSFIIKKISEIFENAKEQIKETIIDELNITFNYSQF